MMIFEDVANTDEQNFEHNSDPYRPFKSGPSTFKTASTPMLINTL